MNKLAVGCLGMALLLSVPLLRGRGDEEKKGASQGPKSKVIEIMHQKLEHSQKVLEGIAVGGFDTIAKHADALVILSKKAEWRVLKTPQYEMYSNEFQRAGDNLVKNAKDKNLDAAALTYVEMTLNCVRCHKYVREQRMARRAPTPGTAFAFRERGSCRTCNGNLPELGLCGAEVPNLPSK